MHQLWMSQMTTSDSHTVSIFGLTQEELILIKYALAMSFPKKAQGVLKSKIDERIKYAFTPKQVKSGTVSKVS